MVYLIAALVVCAVLIVFLLFTGITFSGLPVLMYHKVIDTGSPDDLSITTTHLEQQLSYLARKKYSPILLSDFLNHLYNNQPLPPKPVMITFDDGYRNNYTCLYPLLKKYNLKANIFLVAGFIDSSTNSASGKTEFLHIDDIKDMNSDVIQFGLHTYDHKSYNDLSISQIEEDIRNSRKRLTDLQVPYQPCLAYTYGAYPKKDAKKRNQMFRTMQATGVQCAFRIGNRVNKIPLKDKFLVQRIDIRGDESFALFKLILVTGKKILFK